MSTETMTARMERLSQTVIDYAIAVSEEADPTLTVLTTTHRDERGAKVVVGEDQNGQRLFSVTVVSSLRTHVEVEITQDDPTCKALEVGLELAGCKGHVSYTVLND